MKTLVIYTNQGIEQHFDNYDILINNDKSTINDLYYECPKSYCYYLIIDFELENINLKYIVNLLEQHKPAILVLKPKIKIYHRSVIHYVYPLLDIGEYGDEVYDIQNIVEEPLMNYKMYMNKQYMKDRINYRSKLYKLFSNCIIKRNNEPYSYRVIDETIEKANFLNTFDIFKYFDIEHSYFKMKRIKFHKNNREMYGDCGMYHFNYDFHNINRNSVINHLIKKYDYKTYLEIGVYNCSHFNDVLVEKKYGVDPSPKLDDPIYRRWSNNIHLYTSTEFFEILDNNEKFDMIFIDGCLYEKNVSSDVKSALEHISENGTIVLHDCNPPNHFFQRDNYNARYKGIIKNNVIWNNRTYTDRHFVGKVWKVISKLRTTREDLEVSVVDCDWGVGIIRRGHQELFKTDEDINDYRTFIKYRKYMLNLISVDKFLEKYN